ncbi:hypothetical protein GGE24_007569 [Bradyrhizobium centrosematis]|nr:hypothetical protein [Bradyrhizobium centrosematis]MCS3778193.1 hypothetical protein [Bradyrhizobium centrosematis]
MDTFTPGDPALLTSKSSLLTLDTALEIINSVPDYLRIQELLLHCPTSADLQLLASAFIIRQKIQSDCCTGFDKHLRRRKSDTTCGSRHNRRFVPQIVRDHQPTAH